MIYFAYGSNLCLGRLRGRVPSATKLYPATLSGHTLRFNKRSADGSGKANAQRTEINTDLVRGVVFQIDDSQRADLDRAEGLNAGYSLEEITVLDDGQTEREVSAYLAQPDYTDDNLKPYSWYKRFVVDGARQQNFPTDYIALIEAVDSIEDEDKERDRQERAISC